MPLNIHKGGATRPHFDTSAVAAGKVGVVAVDDRHLDDGAVDEQSLHDGAATRAVYGADAGTSGKILSHAVNGDKLADRCIRERHIRPGKVLGKHFRRDSVGERHLDENTIYNINFADRSIRARHIPPLSLWGFHIDYMSWRKISGGLNNLVAPGGFDGDVATRTETGVEWRTQGGYWEKIRSTPFIIGDGLANAPGDGLVLRIDPGKNLDHYTNVWMRMEAVNEGTPTIIPRYMLDLAPQLTNPAPDSVNAQLLSGVFVGMRNSFGQVVFVRPISSTQFAFTSTDEFPTVDPFIIKDVWGERNFSRVTSSEDYDAAVDDILTPEERREKQILEIIRKIIGITTPPGGGGGGSPPPPPPTPDDEDDEDDGTDPGTQIPDTDDTNDRQPPPPPIPIYRPTNPGTPTTPPPVTAPPPVGRPRPPTAPHIPAPPVAPTNPSPTPPPTPTPTPDDTDTDDNYRYEPRPDANTPLPPVSGIGTTPTPGTPTPVDPGGGGGTPEEPAPPNNPRYVIEPDGSVWVIDDPTQNGGAPTQIADKEDVDNLGGDPSVVININFNRGLIVGGVVAGVFPPLFVSYVAGAVTWVYTSVDERRPNVHDKRPPPAVGVQPSPGGGGGGGGGGYIPPGYQPPSQEEYDNYWS